MSEKEAEYEKLIDYVGEKLYLAGIELTHESIEMLARHAKHYGEAHDKHVDDFIQACINLALTGDKDG